MRRLLLSLLLEGLTQSSAGGDVAPARVVLQVVSRTAGDIDDGRVSRRRRRHHPAADQPPSSSSSSSPAQQQHQLLSVVVVVVVVARRIGGCIRHFSALCSNRTSRHETICVPPMVVRRGPIDGAATWRMLLHDAAPVRASLPFRLLPVHAMRIWPL